MISDRILDNMSLIFKFVFDNLILIFNGILINGIGVLFFLPFAVAGVVIFLIYFLIKHFDDVVASGELLSSVSSMYLEPGAENDDLFGCSK